MNEENIRAPEIVNIKIVKVLNLRGSKGDVVSATIKVEYREKVLGESAKVECTLDSPAIFNYNAQYQVTFDDPSVLDEMTYRPVILTVIEVLPKEKKQKEEKTQILGQCTFDILPLFRGNNKFELTLKINPVTGSPLEQLQMESAQPTVDIEVSCDNPLIQENQSANIVSITLESLYSPPEAFTPNASGTIYTTAFSFPLTEDRENVFVFPSGVVKTVNDKDYNSKRIKWVNAGSVGNESIFIPNCQLSSDGYENEDGELKDEASKPHRVMSEKEKNKVLWNMERRSVIQQSALKLLQSRIAKYRKWPVEVFRIGGSVQNKSRKDEDSLVNYHGYALINLSPLLFPGVKRIRGAYKVFPYNEAEYAEITGKKTGIVDEATRITNSMLHQSSTSVGGKKPAEKKQEKKGAAAKPAGSSMGQNASDPLASESTEALTNSEGQQYLDNGSYVVLEIKLDKPLVDKRQPEEVASRVSEYIPSRDKLPKKVNNAEKALEDYHNQVAQITKQLLAEFRSMFAEDLKNAEVLNNQDMLEQMRQELIYDLNSSGKYFAFKEQLKYAVIKIVREKCLRTSTITDQNELQEFLRTLFVYLVDELQVGLKKVITLKDTSEPPSVDISPEQLLHFAEEAESNEDFVWADRYYKERIAKDRNNAQYWFDYGVYMMGQNSLTDAEHCFKECISISPQFLNGLISYGVVCALQNRLEEAEIFMEAATTYHPGCVFAWTVRALFYNSIGNEIQYDMAVQEANKANSPVRKPKKMDIVETADPADQTELYSEQIQDGPQDTVRSVETSNELEISGTENTLADTSAMLTNETVNIKSEEDAGQTRKESIQSNLKQTSEKRNTLPTIPLSKSAQFYRGNLNQSPSVKSKSSGKDVDQMSEVSKSEEIPRSIYLKTAYVLLDFRSFAYLEKALAQELIYQDMKKSVTSPDHQNILTAEYHLLLAKSHLLQSSFPIAESNLLQTLEIIFDNADAWAQLGHLKFLVGDGEAAESCFTRALSLLDDVPEPHQVYMRLASLYLIKEKYVDARQAFLLACKKNPTCLSWLGVGVACYKLSDLDEAEEALAEANILNNENPEVWGYLSLICLKTNRKVEAEQSYKYSVRLGLSDRSPTLLEEINELQAAVGFGNPEID